MASLRTGYGLPARPSEGLRTRRPSDSAQSGGLPRPVNRPGKVDPEPPLKTSLQSPTTQSRLPSRVPQPTVAPRSAGRPQAARRPSLDHQTGSQSSASTATSGRSRSHTQTGSGSSSSSNPQHDSRLRPNNRIALRRKQPLVGQDVAVSTKLQAPLGGPSAAPRSRMAPEPSLGYQNDRYMTQSPAEIDRSDETEELALGQSPMIYPELDRYRNLPQYSSSSDEQSQDVLYKLSTHDLPPPTPGSLLFSGSSSQLSASPSTKFSASPGPGPYSRDTTPTSISSQSPGLTSAAKFNAGKTRQQSPAYARPPVTRRRAGSTPNEVDAISNDPNGLASVRESLNSSSSSSTVKDGDRNTKEKRRQARHLPPPPPSPPPRKSSQKFRKDSDDESQSAPVDTSSRPRPDAMYGSAQNGAALSAPPRVSASPTKISNPRRPTRDGTPDGQSRLLRPTAPVMPRNTSSTSLPTERRGSESSDLAPTYHGVRDASTTQLPVSKDFVDNSKPSGSKIADPNSTGRATRTPSPNISSSFRFPFFGRKKTTADSPPKAKKETKKDAKDKKSILRKGPAAGTGHEGYGRTGAVRRRSGSSNLSRGFAENQTSQESLISNDAYFANKMTPVVIAGGEVVENRNASSELSRTESNQSIPISRPSTDSKTGVGSRSTMWPSGTTQASQSAASSRRPSDSSNSEVEMKPTLAFRRSIQRLRNSPDDPFRLPQPINTSGVASSPMTSFDTSVMSDESHLETQREMVRGRNAAHPAPKKLTKRDRSPRKWNLFGRSQKSSTAKKENSNIAVAHQPEENKKSVAFYTMIDPSEQDLTEGTDIQDVLRHAEVYSASPIYGTPELSSSGFQTPEIPQQVMRASPRQFEKVYHGPAPIVSEKPTEPKSQVLPPPANATLSSGRPSRLQQVGRIPKVVSNRQDQPSPKSFSRPFRASIQTPPQPAECFDPQSVAKGPSPPRMISPLPTLTKEGSCSDSLDNGLSTVESPNKIHFEGEHSAPEFLRFSPRKNSEGTVGTSSSSGLFPYNSATAVIPGASDPPAEDEIWDEYDDLLEDERKIRLSTTSSKGIPFHLETYHSNMAKEKPMESPTLAPDRIRSTHSLAPTASSCYSADMTERIRNAFQPHLSSEHLCAEQDADSALSKLTEAQGQPLLGLTPKRRSLSPIEEGSSDGSCSSSEDGSPLAQVNLRVGSMTVSKWLTFGHVLFSDVRHGLIAEEGSLKRPSILVIDGLGNDDWSFYAAETYPAATFFNLSPRAPLPDDLKTSPSSFPLTPPNHHQIQFVSQVEKFPFAPQSFSSVVYRFPVAAPESHYRNALSEARRVLKPGGYLELSILDVDLNSMGHRGRRAVRQVKERLHAKDPDTNLASTADLLVRLVDNAGFYDVKAARVGVPVASSIGRSHDSIRLQDRKAASKKNQPSLSEMMSDSSAKGDESITKMVARVGRWWYTRCYENVAETSFPSIWDDKRLLRECEEMGTSLKLMVCCGRAPDRVSSV